ncbi:MAG: hypothetical protein RL323_203 [Pseudomonadota bacterium]|jgi:mono/diheme cytochrome c family protein
MYLHRSINATQFARLVGGAGVPPQPAGPQDLAERLGAWLNAFDAVKLHATCQACHSARAFKPAPLVADAAHRFTRLNETVQRVHQGLVAAIKADRWPQETGDEADAALLRKHALELQRLMEAKLTAVRPQVWQAMAGASPRLRQLVELDAAMAQVVEVQAQKSLAHLPALIEKQLKTSAPAQRLEPQLFWQQVLLAELDLRMQPIWGLMEAFNNEVNKSQ